MTTIFPEHESVEVFVQECLDDEVDHFTTADLLALNHGTQERLSDLRATLEGYGLRFVPREPERHVRGCTTGSNDRYYGPGSEKMHGGTGEEQIQGWAGQEG
jgi:hypothetical protein